MGNSVLLLSDLVTKKKERMEAEVIEAELVLPTYMSFKRIQMYEKYPKGQSRGRHWKHLKQILQAENYQNYPPDEPNCKLMQILQTVWKTQNKPSYAFKLFVNFDT